MALLAVMAAAGTAVWAISIDQSQPIATAAIARFVQGDLAQSFQQAHGNIAGAGLFLEPSTYAADTVTISMWDDLPDEGGSLLASGSAQGSPGSWCDVYWGPMPVIPDHTMFLVFTSVRNELGVNGSTANPYPRGSAYAGTGYAVWPAYDYAFKTFYDDQFVAVPAPGAVLLVALGAGLVGRLCTRGAIWPLS